MPTRDVQSAASAVHFGDVTIIKVCKPNISIVVNGDGRGVAANRICGRRHKFPARDAKAVEMRTNTPAPKGKEGRDD